MVEFVLCSFTLWPARASPRKLISPNGEPLWATVMVAWLRAESMTMLLETRLRVTVNLSSASSTLLGSTMISIAPDLQHSICNVP